MACKVERVDLAIGNNGGARAVFQSRFDDGTLRGRPVIAAAPHRRDCLFGIRIGRADLCLPGGRVIVHPPGERAASQRPRRAIIGGRIGQKRKQPFSHLLKRIGRGRQNGELALLSTTNMPIGGTVSTVKSSTYAFGFFGGALVGLLLALQLTLIDKRVRTIHQLSKKFGSESVLGEIKSGKNSVEHVAAAIVAKANQQSISAVSVLPANEKFSVEVLGSNLSAITQQLGLTVEALPEIDLVNASQLLSSPRAAVVVAQSGKTRFEEIERTCAILRAANTLVLGILLVWPTE